MAYRKKRKQCQVVFVGEPKCGKSSIISVTLNGTIPQSMKKTAGFTIIDSDNFLLTVEQTTYTVILWDTISHEHFCRLQSVPYSSTDIFILCIDISDTNTFHHQYKWNVDMYQQAPHATRIVLGTKSDLRESNPFSMDLVSRKEGIQFCRDIGAAMYIEVSAQCTAHVQIMKMWHEIVQCNLWLKSTNFSGYLIPKYGALRIKSQFEMMQEEYREYDETRGFIASAYCHDHYGGIMITKTERFPISVCSMSTAESRISEVEPPVSMELKLKLQDSTSSCSLSVRLSGSLQKSQK